MDKNFSNLPAKYKYFLQNYHKLISKEQFDKIINKTIDAQELNKIHNKINEYMNQNNCNNYDLNKMFKGYNKKNVNLELLKRLAKLRNRSIVSSSYNSDKWKENINCLKDKCVSMGKKNINKQNIEKAFISLINKYKNDWNGLNSIFVLSGGGKVQDINVFDIDDINYIISLL